MDQSWASGEIAEPMQGRVDHDSDPLAVARDEAQGLLARLTDKQVEILELSARGHTIEAISHQLGKHRRTIEDHFVALRKHLDVESNREAIERFIILRTICGEPTRGFQRVDLSNEDIEKLFRALSFDAATKILTSEDFREFMRSYRARGPKAWRARFGRGWVLLMILLLAVLILGLQVGGLAMVAALDGYFSAEPS